jgi:hypothetical protein
VLETKQRETEQRIKQLQASNGSGQPQDVIISPEQEKTLESYQKTLIEVGRDLKQVRKSLRKDTDALEFWTKVSNIAGMPAVVAFSGLCLAITKTRRRTAK